jgi:hypothetical protein
MLITSPELVFHSAGVKELIGRRTSGRCGLAQRTDAAHGVALNPPTHEVAERF